MRLVDNQRVVGGKVAVGLRFGQQDAVCHQLDIGFARGVVVKTHFVAHRLPDGLPQFFGNAFGNRPRRQTARLGVPD